MVTVRTASVGVATNALSKTRQSTVTFSALPATPVDLANSCFVTGEHSTKPTVYTDLAHPNTTLLSATDRLAIDITGGLIAGQFTAGMGSNTVGQRIWLAYYQNNPTPSGTDAPDDSFDCGLLVA